MSLSLSGAGTPLPAPESLCRHCRGASGHPVIGDEGFPVCYPCLVRLGREAAKVADQWADIEQARVDRRLREMFGEAA